LIRYYFGDEIKEDEMGKICSRHGEIRNIYNILIGNHGRKRPLRKFYCRWEDNITMDFNKTV
jgi:hypothetical protein